MSKITPAGMPELGVIEAKTTSFGGHPPEFWASRLTEKIVSHSENEDPHIKEQARAFKDQMTNVLLHYVALAKKQERDTICQVLISNGHQDMANIIRRV